MENTVNSRVLLLKKETGLTDVQFCVKGKLSTFTLNKIRNNEDVSMKIYTSLINEYNVNKEWLLHGKGKMFADAPKAESSNSVDPWKDALVMQVKEENNRLVEQVRWLQQMVSQFTNGVKPNFLKAPELAYNTMFFPNKTFAIGSVALNA